MADQWEGDESEAQENSEKDQGAICETSTGGGLDALGQVMGAADFVVVSLPLTDQTRSIVDARALAAMRPDAVIVNVGRGPVIDEAALFDALDARRLTQS